jgi:hypothetical protein
MLYPKRNQEFRQEEFKNPGSEYRAAPFWAWNNRLDKEDLVWQIERLKEMGYGGFHMHVRTGLATEYLSDEYMDIIRACVEKARAEGMLAWLYDEDRWPSGAAGGLVTRHEQYRIQHLLLTRHPYGVPGKVSAKRRNRATNCRNENGKFIACFDVTLDTNGCLESYRRIGESDRASGIKLYAYIESALPVPWFNNQTYANTLDPAAIREFIRVTYERYEKYFAADFGALIPAIFTDEPQFSQKETLDFARDDQDISLPWTTDIEETYKTAYQGESLTEALPELLWDLSGGAVSKARYHYHDHLAERFAVAFADQCGAWCEEHGIMLTGHMMDEPTLESQTNTLGEAMRSYRSFHLPGIDMLCDWHEFTTAKQAQSAARQMGIPGILSELYGVTNWDFDFRHHKLQGDWQAALGVTVRVPHLSWVSMNGEAKRDYPASFNYQSPWYKEYPYVEDHFARVAYVMTRGEPVVRIGVIHPIESYWLHWGDKENTHAIREEMDRQFLGLCGWLLRGLIDFDYICESILPDSCGVDDISANVFPVGKMRYQAIIVPPVETIRSTTLDRLETFQKAGGRIIFLGEAPKYSDAIPCDRGRKLRNACEVVSFERIPVLNALSAIREIDIRGGSGAPTEKLLYQMREEGDTRWLFIAHADNPANPDIPLGDIIQIRIKGEWAATLYNTINGEIVLLSADIESGWTIISRPLYEHDSLLIRLEKTKGDAAVRSGAPTLVTSPVGIDGRRTIPVAPPCICFPLPVPVTLHEPNVLLLDMAEYALDGGAWAEREEILRLDNKLRAGLGWPPRGDDFAQPWVEHDASVPHILRLRYAFESEISVSGAELALENAGRAKVSLNGEEAGPPECWYVDKCIGRVKLPPVKTGSNILELTLPYGKKTNLEAVYLLGDFGVSVAGTFCTLTSSVRSLAFGDITRQGLPFYGGNISYHLEAESEGRTMILTVSSYRGHLLRVKADGLDRGVIAYSPYRLEVPDLAKGTHRIELVYFGSRINTFGQLHANVRDPGFWWGPNSWRSQGPAWTYEYRFWPQGVLKSPEITQELVAPLAF